jgi:hypothetical protein
MEPNSTAIRRWLEGEQTIELNFSALWKILLIRVADRASDLVDEEGHSINLTGDRRYSYDLALVAEFDNIFVSTRDLQRVASHLEQHNWAALTRRSPVQLELTADGMDKAEEILNEVLEAPTRRRKRAPAANRYVQLDDNSQTYQTATARLEELIKSASEIRVNDWPEKEGVLASLNAALSMLKTKYVNKSAIIAAVSSGTTFILLKFVDAPIAELASNTWKAVKALF